MIDEYIRAPAHSNITSSFIYSYRFEGLDVVHVDRLKELLRSTEDDERMAGDVCLVNESTGS